MRCQSTSLLILIAQIWAQNPISTGFLQRQRPKETMETEFEKKYEHELGLYSEGSIRWGDLDFDAQNVKLLQSIRPRIVTHIGLWSPESQSRLDPYQFLFPDTKTWGHYYLGVFVDAVGPRALTWVEEQPGVTRLKSTGWVASLQNMKNPDASRLEVSEGQLWLWRLIPANTSIGSNRYFKVVLVDTYYNFSKPQAKVTDIWRFVGLSLSEGRALLDVDEERDGDPQAPVLRVCEDVPKRRKGRGISSTQENKLAGDVDLILVNSSKPEADMHFNVYAARRQVKADQTIEDSLRYIPYYWVVYYENFQGYTAADQADDAEDRKDEVPPIIVSALYRDTMGESGAMQLATDLGDGVVQFINNSAGKSAINIDRKEKFAASDRRKIVELDTRPPVLDRSKYRHEEDFTWSD